MLRFLILLFLLIEDLFFHTSSNMHNKNKIDWNTIWLFSFFFLASFIKLFLIFLKKSDQKKWKTRNWNQMRKQLFLFCFHFTFFGILIWYAWIELRWWGGLWICMNEFECWGGGVGGWIIDIKEWRSWRGAQFVA